MNAHDANAKALPRVDLVVPTLNEAHVIDGSIAQLRAFVDQRFSFPARIVVVDNGSTDGTFDRARALARSDARIHAIRLPERGRGRALRHAWMHSDAAIVAYTDADLSTGLDALEPMCRAIWHEGYDIATGSRLMRGARVTRGLKRELISRSYNWIVRTCLSTGFSDAQCGLKALSREVANTVVPRVEDEGWFFDTELMTLAERQGYRIKDVPVRWVDDRDSRVRIAETAAADLRGIWRLRRTARRHPGHPRPEALRTADEA